MNIISGMIKIKPGDSNSLDGIVENPVQEDMLIQNIRLWNGRSDAVDEGQSVVVKAGKIENITDVPPTEFSGRVIDGQGKMLIPGLIDTHVHMLHDSGPELLTNPEALVEKFCADTNNLTEYNQDIVRRGMLKLKSGTTTMRILGDGYYSLKYRDDLSNWQIVGPRVFTAGVHINGPAGYISGGIARNLDAFCKLNVALEINSFEEIVPKVEKHIAKGVDVVKIATTIGSMGFADAEPDLPEAWVREIVKVAHDHGLKVNAHTYGEEGNWAAIRGGVDGIEHLVNVPHELSDEMVAEIKQRDIVVCPTLSGSSYGIMNMLNNADSLINDPDIVANVSAKVRKDLFKTVWVLKLPGFTRFVMKEPKALQMWQHWHEHTLANTTKLYAAGVRLIFGSDLPFFMGNFWHSIMNEVRALKLTGINNLDILKMATVYAAEAMGVEDKIGTIETGKLADLVLLAGNAIEDIEKLKNVAMVVKEGYIVYQKPI